MKNICIFGASSEKLEQHYYDTAYELGCELAKAGYGMVFGAGKEGLMGAAARGVKAQGGCITGVIPVKLDQPGVAFEHCDELIRTQTMHERKSIMERLSAGFVALPGGFGTIEELMEVITLKQLGYHDCPIVILNENGFYDPLIRQFKTLVRQGFAHTRYLDLYHVAYTAKEAAAYFPAVIKEQPAPELSAAEVPVQESF